MLELDSMLLDNVVTIAKLVSTVGQGLTVTDTGGRFVYVNLAYAQMVGYPQQALIGSTPFDVTLPADHAVLREAHTRRHRGRMVTYRTYLQRADGCTVYARISEVPLHRRGRAVGSVAVITDLTERRQAEEALHKSEHAIRALCEIAAQQTTFAVKIQALLTMGCRRFGLETGVLAHVVGDHYEVAASHSPDNSVSPGVIYALDSTYDCDVLRASGPISFEHARESEWVNHPAYQSFELEAYLGTPVLVGDKVYGVLSFCSPDPRLELFKPADREFLCLMAQWMGSAIEREQYIRRGQVYAGDELFPFPSGAPEGTAVGGQTPAEPRALILLVEDDPVNQRVARLQLEKLGCAVHAVRSGREALDAVQSGRDYTLVLVACQLPGMDGYETARAIRSLEEASGGYVPIVGMTARALRQERNKCALAEMDGCISKPMTQGALGKVVQRWVSPVEAVSQHKAAADPSLAAEDSLSPVMLQDLREITGDDSALLSEIITLFLARTPSRMAAIRDAVNRGDAQALEHAAHKLRSTSGQMGAASMLRLCAELETLGRSGTTVGASELVEELVIAYQQVKRALEVEGNRALFQGYRMRR